MNALCILLHLCVYHVHLRRSDEACYELIARLVVQILRRIHLLNHSVLHNDDSGSQSHGLCLIVGNVDNRCAQLLVELGNLDTHLAS